MDYMDYFESCCNELDAAVFTGDSLQEEKNRVLFSDYLIRWGRELALIKECTNEKG